MENINTNTVNTEMTQLKNIQEKLVCIHVLTVQELLFPPDKKNQCRTDKKITSVTIYSNKYQ